MGTTTSTVYVTKANVTTPTPVIVSIVPSDILGLAVTHLNITGVSPAPANDDNAAAKNEQIIHNHVTEWTRALFEEEFQYNPGKTFPEDFNTPSTGVMKLLDTHEEKYWYHADDPESDEKTRRYVKNALDHLKNKPLEVFAFTQPEYNEIVEEIIKDINKVFYLNYSVWTSDTDNYHGPLKKVNVNGKDKKVRAQIDIAYYAFRGKEGGQGGKEGVYICILSAIYMAVFNPF